MAWSRAVVMEMGRGGWSVESFRKESVDGDWSRMGRRGRRGICLVSWMSGGIIF